MSNIFHKLKSFSFLSEAKANADIDEHMTFVQVAPDIYDRFPAAMRAIGAVTVFKYPNDNTKYAIVTDDESSKNNVMTEVNRLVGEKKAELITPDQVHQKMMDLYFLDTINGEVKKLSNVISKNETIDNVNLIGIQAAVTALSKQIDIIGKRIGRQTDENIKKSKSAQINSMNETIKTLSNELEIKANKNIVEIRKLLNNVDYRNKDVAMVQVSRAITIMHELKSHKLLNPTYETQFMNKIIDIKRKLGLDDDAFKLGIEHAVGEELTYIVNKFVFGSQKSMQEVEDEYALVKSHIESQRRQLNHEVYDKLQSVVDKAMETKIAIFKTIKERPDLVVDLGEKPAVSDGVQVSPDSGTINKYEFNILPLGQTVTITDLDKFKSKSGKLAAEDDMKNRSIVGSAEATVFNLMGYTPKGDAAGVISAYGPARKFIGNVATTVLTDATALLGSVIGKDLSKVGANIGKFIKYEMIQDPTEINPALAEMEGWLHSKFNIKKMMAPKSTPHRAGENVDKAVESFDKKLSQSVMDFDSFNSISEQAVAAAAPAPAGVAPGGDGMNNPGMITGEGNPIAPTPTTKGSGDNFNPRKKKKEVDVKETVMSFEEFRNALYENNK